MKSNCRGRTGVALRCPAGGGDDPRVSVSAAVGHKQRPGTGPPPPGVPTALCSLDDVSVSPTKLRFPHAETDSFPLWVPSVHQHG